MQFLIDHLEEEGPDDVTYYLDAPTLAFLAAHGADADLVATLRAALAPQGHLELRYARPGAR